MLATALERAMNLGGTMIAESIPGLETLRTSKHRFADEKKREIANRALMLAPQRTPFEDAEVAGVSRVFDVLAQNIVIKHPHAPILVELSPVIGPRLSYLIAIGDYEQSDLDLLQRYVQRGDSVLELGGGAGLTSALCAKISGKPVVVVEPDLRLHSIIKRQSEINGVHVTPVHTCITASDAAYAELQVHPEFWFTSTVKGIFQPSKTVVVAAVSLQTVLGDHKPDFLMIDIEGAERGIFSAALPHKPRTILIEIHDRILGARGACAVTQEIINQGYTLVDQEAWTRVFVCDDRQVLIP